MRVWMLALLGLAGCTYVSKAEYERAWDHDADGWPVGWDCAVDNEAIYPWAPDVRGDGCDSDCGRTPDRDGDDWPDDADCNPDDASIFPCAEDGTGDGVDSDCDGLDTPRTDGCNGPIAGTGWDPDFGEDEQVLFRAATCSCPSGDLGACDPVDELEAEGGTPAE